jgi:hypothetical protein
MYRTCVVFFIIMNLIGCSSNKLSSPSGDGAFAIPIKLETTSRTFACRKVTLHLFEISDAGVSDTPLLVSFFPKKADSYTFFDGVKIGNYSVDNFRCFPNKGWIFNSFQEYVDVEAYGRLLSIEANRMTIPDFMFYGKEVQKRFFISLPFSSSEAKKNTIELIKKEHNLDGWTFK